MNQIIARSLENNIRREYRHPSGKFRTGKLVPIMAVPFLPNEGGLLEQTVNIKLDAILGDLISDIHAEVTAIYVPIQALDALLNSTDPSAGITEVIRRKIMDGQGLFGLENESELTKRMDINPRSYSLVKKVSPIARLAYNASVNYLRKRRYIYAEPLLANNNVVANAIIGETVLDRFNAALDPDEHINGNVPLRLSQTEAPVRGIHQMNNSTVEVDGGNTSMTFGANIRIGRADGGHIYINRLPGNPAGTAVDIRADLSQVEADGMSLTDLYNAEKADQLIRMVREIAKKNPQDGEDAILRFAFGLSTDTGQHPFEIFHRRGSLLDMRRNAMDAVGITDEVSSTTTMSQIDFSVPVPKTELGGIVITLIQVTPDEVIDSQPHPILTEDWGHVNVLSEQMKLDPQKVSLRDMFSDPATAAAETGTVMYVGHNQLKRQYASYGFNRHVDPETVTNKTVLWQYAIPAGVTPTNINYPDDLDQFPFADYDGEVVTYHIESLATINTPMYFGPSPVEKVAIIDEHNLLGEDE